MNQSHKSNESLIMNILIVAMVVFVPMYIAVADYGGSGGGGGSYSFQDRDGDGVYTTYYNGVQQGGSNFDINDANAWVGAWNSLSFNTPGSNNYSGGSSNSGSCCTSSDGLY